MKTIYPASATSVSRLVWVVAIALGSYALTLWLSEAPSKTPGFSLALGLSGPSLLYFLAHGGSLALWGVGLAVVVAPLLLAAARNQPGLRPFIVSALTWLGLSLVFGFTFLLGALV